MREFGEHAQYAVPWFLLPPSYVYDGRTVVRDELTPTQRIAIPLVQYFNAISRRGGAGEDLSLMVGPPRTVEPATDLAAVVDSLHAIHRDRGVTGTVEIRRTDHPDGRRSWTVLLPSTQAMLPGGANPVAYPAGCGPSVSSLQRQRPRKHSQGFAYSARRYWCVMS